MFEGLWEFQMLHRYLVWRKRAHDRDACSLSGHVEGTAKCSKPIACSLSKTINLAPNKACLGFRLEGHYDSAPPFP